MKNTIDAMKQAVEALSYYQVGMNDFDCHKAVENDKAAIIALNKAIAREEAKTVEPNPHAIDVNKQSTEWKERYLQKLPEYPAPPPSGERVPMTDAEIATISEAHWLYPRRFARAIEAHHHIGVTP